MTAAQPGGRSTHLNASEGSGEAPRYVPALRAALAERHRQATRYIITEPGVGYRFVKIGASAAWPRP